MILSSATCFSAAIAFVAAVSDESHFASLETWTLLSGLGAAAVAALTHTLYFRIRRSQWYERTTVLQQILRDRYLCAHCPHTCRTAGRDITKAKLKG